MSNTHQDENNNINDTNGDETEDELSAMNNIYEVMNIIQKTKCKSIVLKIAM